jgi:hypothetical protein
MIRSLVPAFFAALLAVSCASDEGLPPVVDTFQTSDDEFAKAYLDKREGFWVKRTAPISRILPDDTVGDRHQRMIVRLPSGQTLLIAHNVDIAPRVPNPAVGKDLFFAGDYAWNAEGGLVHWTHKDPAGVHRDGGLEYEGKAYR